MSENYQPLCMCCEHPLVLIEKEDYEDGIVVHHYKCEYCGLEEEAVTPPWEEQLNYPAYSGQPDDGPGVSHGYPGLCPECGHHIVWGADFMASEILGEEIPEDDDSLAPHVFCPHCGAAIQLIYPRPSEEKNYDYYK